MRIQEQPFRLLVLLLERPGEVVTREELRALLWPSDTFVDFDHGLNTAVKKVRQALDDSAEAPRYVETVARRGYRFVAPVTVDPVAGPRPPTRAFPRWAAWTAGAAVVAALIAGAGPRMMRPRKAPSIPPAARAPALAVLPFANLSGDPQDEYLAEGLTESLITELAKVPGLLVISRTGVAAYEERPVDVRRVGADLNVGHVLEGSVQRSGGQLRVTAQLIDTGTGLHAWAEKYDRPSADVFALQDEISGKVRDALRPSLGKSGPARLRATTPEAYDAYLRGRFHLREARQGATARVRGETESAIGFLETAVARDPRFAPAHATLAIAYVTLFFNADPDLRWKEKAAVAIEKALAIDPDLAEAYLARSLLSWTLANGFPHEQAIEDARRAATLDPSLMDARLMLARVYEHVGLLDEALRELEAARKLAPHDRLVDSRYGQVYLDQQDLEKAWASYRKIPEGDLDEELATVLVYMGRAREGLAAAREAQKRNPRNDAARATEALALARLGDRAGALRAAAEAARLGKGLGHFHHDEHIIAAVHALLGEKQEAVAWLRRAADHGFPCHPCFSADPNLASLRGDPAFEGLMAELRQRREEYRALVR